MNELFQWSKPPTIEVDVREALNVANFFIEYAWQNRQHAVECRDADEYQSPMLGKFTKFVLGDLSVGIMFAQQHSEFFKLYVCEVRAELPEEIDLGGGKKIFTVLRIEWVEDQSRCIAAQRSVYAPEDILTMRLTMQDWSFDE